MSVLDSYTPKHLNQFPQINNLNHGALMHISPERLPLLFRFTESQDGVNERVDIHLVGAWEDTNCILLSSEWCKSTDTNKRTVDINLLHLAQDNQIQAHFYELKKTIKNSEVVLSILNKMDAAYYRLQAECGTTLNITAISLGVITESFEPDQFRMYKPHSSTSPSNNAGLRINGAHRVQLLQRSKEYESITAFISGHKIHIDEKEFDVDILFLHEPVSAEAPATLELYYAPVMPGSLPDHFMYLSPDKEIPMNNSVTESTTASFTSTTGVLNT